MYKLQVEENPTGPTLHEALNVSVNRVDDLYKVADTYTNEQLKDLSEGEEGKIEIPNVINEVLKHCNNLNEVVLMTFLIGRNVGGDQGYQKGRMDGQMEVIQRLGGPKPAPSEEPVADVQPGPGSDDVEFSTVYPS